MARNQKQIGEHSEPFQGKETEMKRMRFKWHELSLVVLVVALCLPAGSAGAQEELIWPVETPFLAKDWNSDDYRARVAVGNVSIWNTKDDLNIFIFAAEGFRFEEVNIHIVVDPEDFPLDKLGKPKISKLDYKTDYLEDYGILAPDHLEVIPLDDLPGDICWGVDPEKCPPDRYIIVHAELRMMDEYGEWVPVPEVAYASGAGEFERLDREIEDFVWGYYVVYPLAKVDAGHFIDANVNGLAFTTPTQLGVTGDNGQFWFLPGERIDFKVGSVALGNALSDRRVSPVDLFESSDWDDDRVINMAWLLQSLDGDGNPAQGAINITGRWWPASRTRWRATRELIPVDFADEFAVGELIVATQTECPVDLAPTTREEAIENLVNGQKAGNLVKKNVSKNPAMKADKAKLEIMPVYVPATRADGTATVVSYYDADDNWIEDRSVAKPLVVSYVEEVEGTGSTDVFVAISRDDGETWNRRNISKTADKTSRAGYPGESQKPMLKVKDDLIFVAWTDKYCRGGRPGYAINLCDDPTTEIVETPETGCAVYCTGNPDEAPRSARPTTRATTPTGRTTSSGAGGPQRSVIYEDYPEMGEVAFSCVWTARGVVEPATGDIQWFKPERLTSGRRDAYQLFAGAGEDVAFGIVWQEDPKGLMPGEGDGPGEGWSGANTHNKADIWFSYITMDDFAKIDYDYPAGAVTATTSTSSTSIPSSGAGQGPGADVPAGEGLRQRRLQRREHGPRRRQRRARLRRGRPGHPPLLR